MQVGKLSVSMLICRHAGTPLGDPIEVGALRQALRTSKDATPLALISSKACYGHTEGAAGRPLHKLKSMACCIE